ncbi:MAG: helix-turn-helix domain-containing protein [Candidatus Thorarchaeota archaeon]
MSVDLPNSALIVLSSLTAEGPMTPKTIIKKVKMPSRTTTYALQTLVKEHIVKKTPNLLDMRQPIYHVNLDRVKELRLSFRVDQVIRLHPEIRQSGHQSHTFNR